MKPFPVGKPVDTHAATAPTTKYLVEDEDSDVNQVEAYLNTPLTDVNTLSGMESDIVVCYETHYEITSCA